MSSKRHARPQLVLYYDGDCGFCRRVARRLSRLDWSGRITWVPFQSLDSPPPGLSWEDLNQSVYLDTGTGPYHEGFYAFRMLTLKLVPLWPLAAIMWLPGVNVPGVAAYRWVSRNRYRLSRCRMWTL